MIDSKFNYLNKIGGLVTGIDLYLAHLRHTGF